jgi:hypothetical protein
MSGPIERRNRCGRETGQRPFPLYLKIGKDLIVAQPQHHALHDDTGLLLDEVRIGSLELQ